MSVLENTTNVISILAALVATLSALYARWQAQSVQRANEIALHENRLGIYKGVGRFRSHLTAHGAAFSEDELWRLNDVVQLSEFYFPPHIHDKMNSIFNDAMDLMSKHEQWCELREAGSDEARALAKPKQESMKRLRKQCVDVADELKKHLKVGNA